MSMHLDWTWVDAWSRYEKGDRKPLSSLLGSNVPITESMRELLADLASRGRIKPDPRENEDNVTLLVAAIHFRALAPLLRPHDRDFPERPPRRRPRHSLLRRWPVPESFWLVVGQPIPEETRLTVKDMSKDKLLDLVVRTYGVREESLRSLLAGRGRLYRDSRPHLLSSKPTG